MSAAVDTQQPRTYQDYSLERKAEILALVEANGGNVLQTAQEIGIHHSTIQYWQANQAQFAKIQQGKRIELSSKLKLIAHQCADLLPDRLPNASVRDIVGAMAQSIEKSQLLDGLPTTITENIERQGLTVILESALAAAIDVTPTPNDSTT